MWNLKSWITNFNFQTSKSAESPLCLNICLIISSWERLLYNTIVSWRQVEANPMIGYSCTWAGKIGHFAYSDCLVMVWQEKNIISFCPYSNYMKVDHRSYRRNFCSFEKKTWKNFRLARDSNPWPLRHRCSTLPIKLKSQLGAGRWIGSL